MRPRAKDLASRDVVSRAITIEIREGRGTAPTRTTCICISSHLDPDHARRAAARHHRSGAHLRRRRPHPTSRSRCIPTCHYNMGGIPTNMHGEVISPEGRRSRRDRAGPDGARRGGLRLGAWRQPAWLQLADRSRRVRPRRGASAAPSSSRRTAPCPNCRRARAKRRSRGSTASATPMAARRPRSLRLTHAEDHAARLRRVPHRTRCWRRASRRSAPCGTTSDDIDVTDRSLIWNTDLIETLEFDNLIAQAAVTVAGRAGARGEPRRACARGLPQARRRQLDEAHAVLGRLRHARGRRSTSARCTLSPSPTRSPISSRKSGCIDHGPVHASQELQGPTRARRGIRRPRAPRTGAGANTASTASIPRRARTRASTPIGST